jgi:HAD superfamily hydrolase (TIGR01484 family)
MTQGILALDIDGTLLVGNEPPKDALVLLLTKLSESGWQILFATGRTIRWSLEHLKYFPFPFFLSPYNGACTILFPEKKWLRSSLLQTSSLLFLNPYVQKWGALIYEAGGDERIFWTGDFFEKTLLPHLEMRRNRQNEEWLSISSLQDLPSLEVASVRFFLTPQNARVLHAEIEEKSSLKAPLMKDSFNELIKIVQVTAPQASKGQSLAFLKQLYPSFVSIAAGDDENDEDLLKEADVRIAMNDAPLVLKRIAHIVAPTSKNPLHDALKDAILRIEHGTV